MNKTIELESGIVMDSPENIEEFRHALKLVRDFSERDDIGLSFLDYVRRKTIMEKIIEDLKKEIEEEMNNSDTLSFSDMDMDAMVLFIARMILKHRKYTIELPGEISSVTISSVLVE